MNVNHLFLSVILSFNLALCNNSSDIAMLKKAQSDKMAELETINQIIAKKEDFIDSLTSKAVDIYRDLLLELADKDCKDAFMKNINKYEEKIYENCLTPKNVKKILKEEILSSEFSRERIKRIKFALIRRKAEYLFLEELFDRYQKCLEELLKINLQLDELTKRDLI